MVHKIIQYFNQYKYFKFVNINDEWYITSCQSKGLSSESIKPPTTSNNSLTPAVSYYGTKTSKICWKLFKTTKNFIHMEKQ